MTERPKSWPGPGFMEFVTLHTAQYQTADLTTSTPCAKTKPAALSTIMDQVKLGVSLTGCVLKEEWSRVSTGRNQRTESAGPSALGQESATALLPAPLSQQAVLMRLVLVPGQWPKPIETSNMSGTKIEFVVAGLLAAYVLDQMIESVGPS